MFFVSLPSHFISIFGLVVAPTLRLVELKRLIEKTQVILRKENL